MTCQGKGDPPLNVYWMRLGKRKGSAEYVIDSVEKDDVGAYTCIANITTGQRVEDQYLQIECMCIVINLLSLCILTHGEWYVKS